MWLNLDTLEKHYATNYVLPSKISWVKPLPAMYFRENNNGGSKPAYKQAWNVIIVFHDVSSILYTVSNIHPKAVAKSYHCFPTWKLSLIHGNQDSQNPKKHKTQILRNKMKTDRDLRYKAAQGSNRSKDRGIELINKESWRKRKEKLFNWRNWFIQNVKLV